jgi:hypothetical protein
MKDLVNTKFCAVILVSVTLIGVLSISPAILTLINNLTIRGSGTIGTIAPTAYKNEIRGVFVHSMSMIDPDWDLIAQTLADYAINLLVIEATGNNWAHYASNIIPYESEELTPAIEAAHKYGMELHISMNVMLSAYEGDEQQRRVVLDDGTTANWLCPTKNASRSLLKSIVEEIVRNYDIDGFMFDYIRYDTDRMCYCEECHQKFVEDTRLTDVKWRDDVATGGRYHKDFMEWRIKPITELVRDMRHWMLAIKPELEFSVAAWTLFQDAPTYWRYWIGQDTTDWIAKGYLDMVAPMMYTTNLADIQDYIQTNYEYMIAGPEGIIPHCAFITTGIENPIDPDAFKAVVNKARELSADGWIIWRYGGPGDGQGSDSPDIRNYLSIMDMPDISSLRRIEVSVGDTEATITWTTDLPTTGKVEYSTSPLFNATKKYHSGVDFHYWDIDHVAGSVVEANTLVTEHSVILTNLLPGTKYYIRVQSQDSSGIATSKVRTFVTP